MTIKIQLELPDEIDRQIAIQKAEERKISKEEVIIEILIAYYKKRKRVK